MRVKLKLKIENAPGCTPLSDYAVYIRHCGHDGNYSLYTIP